MATPKRQVVQVVFDWNGTLLDDVAYSVAALTDVMERYLARGTTVDEYRRHFCFPIHSFYERMGFDFSRVAFATLATEYVTLYNESVLGAQLHRGVGELVRELHGKGVSLSVLSASEERTLEKQLHHFGLIEFFKHHVGVADTLATSKLARAAHLQNLLQVDPETVWLIGDTDHDAEVARAMQWHCILVANGHQSIETLRATGFPVLADIRGLVHSKPDGDGLRFHLEAGAFRGI